MAVRMKVRLGTRMSPTMASNPATLHVCKQQIASDKDNKLLFLIHYSS